jgi:pimeloyl-ACP methyl ester carboxylesterase
VTIRRLLVTVIAALLAVTGTAAAAGPATAATAPGTVQSQQTLTLPAELRPYAEAKRITYASTDVRGGSISVTGLVITPKVGKKNKTVAWAHGTTGLADICAPSDHYDVFWLEARAAVLELLRRGWTVAATDYAGLGTPLAHPYLNGYSEARAVIDSVKAARNLDRALTTSYAVDGHSQGGQAALFVGELAPSYDGPLVLRGVAALAPASDLDVLGPLIPGSAGQGYLVMGLYGLAAVEPSFRPSSVLAEPAKQLTPVLQRGCLEEILAAYAGLSATELLVGGQLPQSVLDRLAYWGNPGRSPASAPILVVYGTADEAVPFFVTEEYLLPRLMGQPVRVVKLEGADHEQVVFQSTRLVADWIAARL